MKRRTFAACWLASCCTLGCGPTTPRSLLAGTSHLALPEGSKVVYFREDIKNVRGESTCLLIAKLSPEGKRSLLETTYPLPNAIRVDAESTEDFCENLIARGFDLGYLRQLREERAGAYAASREGNPFNGARAFISKESPFFYFYTCDI